MELLNYIFPSIFFTMSLKFSHLLYCVFFQLKFEGIRGSSYTGDAAIDNVVLKECGGGGGGGGGGSGGCGKLIYPLNK